MFRSIGWKISVIAAMVVFVGMGALEIAQGSLSFPVILGIAAIAIVCAIVTAALVTGLVTSRVDEVTAVAHQMTAGQSAHPVYPGTDDEIGRLTRAFNEMSAKLKELADTASNERGTLETVLNSITDPIVMTDAEGSVVLANPAAERSFNFALVKSRGKHLIEVIQDYHVDDLLKQCLATKSEQTTQIDTRSGGFLRVFAVPVTTIRPHGALLLFQDLTEMRTLQTTRKEFIGNVSHDLRTPLTIIKAIVETLQGGAINDRDTARDFLEKIDTEVSGMTQMVAELMELSRMETGKTELHLTQANLNDLVEECAARITAQAARQDLTISTSLASNLPDIEIDADRIAVVIMNILHNAIKFTPPGGKIAVSTAQEGDSAVVHIADTGIGISKDDLPHIFERFFKADRSRTSGGTGLGLAIAKHTIQIHGGNIWVESEEGRGSTFSFSLPLQTDSASSLTAFSGKI